MDIGGISNYTNSIANQASTAANKISDLSNADMAGKTDDELMEVCKEFESYFLEQIFKEMEKTVSIFKDKEDEGSTSQLVNFFKETTITELASQSTNQNSLGLAQMLYDQMKRNYDL